MSSRSSLAGVLPFALLLPLAIASCRPVPPSAEDFAGTAGTSVGGEATTGDDSEGPRPETSAGTLGSGTEGSTGGGETGPATGSETGPETGPETDTDPEPDPICGNGIVEGEEDCDDQGWSATCDDDCSFAVCGDGLHNEAAGELCDDGGESATCNADCSSGGCGDGITNVTAGEQCDDAGWSASCDLDCTLADCGDLLINEAAGEQCDGAELGGASCMGEGFAGGVLGCDPGCQLDTTGCYACGDGQVDPGEECDGASLGGGTCEGLGFDGGALTCTAGCSYDVSTCYDCALPRCLDILAADPLAPSGIYEIDVDGCGPQAPFDVYCDMDTDGGGWTELTPALGCTLGGTLVAVDGAAIEGIDPECRPFTRDGGDGHTYHYTIPFPGGFTQLMLVDYVARANAGPGDVSDLSYDTLWVQTSWDLANQSARGDISFGAAEEAGPVASFARTTAAAFSCLSCELPYAENLTIYSLGLESQALRLGWGEVGSELEGWYPWWSGTIRLR